MAKTTQSKKDEKMKSATAGAVGAVVGGVVGAAAGIALSDNQKREKIVAKMQELKKYAGTALNEIEQMSEQTTDVIEEQKRPMQKSKTLAK